MVNKGQIHGESDDELRLEIRQFSIRKITQFQIHRIKNKEIWIRICREIKV